MKHELKKTTIVSAYCLCGWRFYNEHLQGKTDDDLKIEAGQEFAKHLAVFKHKDKLP